MEKYNEFYNENFHYHLTREPKNNQNEHIKTFKELVQDATNTALSYKSNIEPRYFKPKTKQPGREYMEYWKWTRSYWIKKAREGFDKGCFISDSLQYAKEANSILCQLKKQKDFIAVIK